MEARRKAVSRHVWGVIGAVMRSAPPARAGMLAQLRRGVGKEPFALPAAAEIEFADLPDVLSYQGDEPSWAEEAIHLALTLFASHQRSQDDCVSLSDRKEEGEAFRRPHAMAAVVGALDAREGSDADMNRHLRSVLGAESFDSLAYHLRQLVSFLRSEDQRLDYPYLAGQLYDYQAPGGRQRVLMEWGREYQRGRSRGLRDPGAARNGA